MAEYEHITDISVDSNGCAEGFSMAKPQKVTSGKFTTVSGYFQRHCDDGSTCTPVFDLPEMTFYDGVQLPEPNKSNVPSLKFTFDRKSPAHLKCEEIFEAIQKMAVREAAKYPASWGFKVDENSFAQLVYKPKDKETLDELTDANHSLFVKFAGGRTPPPFVLPDGTEIDPKTLVKKTIVGEPTVKFQGVTLSNKKLYVQVRLDSFVVTDIKESSSAERVKAKAKRINNVDPEKMKRIQAAMAASAERSAEKAEYSSIDGSDHSGENEENVFGN